MVGAKGHGLVAAILDRRYHHRPRRRGGALAVLVALAVVMTTPAQAQNDDGLFTVTGIDLDETAATAQQARDNALAQARRIAFRRLVERLVAANEEDRVPLPEDRKLRAMVSSLAVESEKFSTTRYLATVSVSFSQQALTEWLSEAGVAFTQAQAKPRLVIPLFEAAGAFELWGEDNPWAAVLDSELARNRLISYRFAEGDTGDRRQLPAARAAAVDSGALEALAKRYDADRVVLARARLGRDFRIDRRVVEYRYTTWPRGASGRGRVIATPEEDQTALLRRAADEIYTRLDARWARQTRARAESENNVSVRVPASSLTEWQNVRRRLQETPLVNAVEIERVSVPVSVFTLRYYGAFDKLKAAARDFGLVLVSGPDGYAVELAAARADEES